MSKEGKYWFPAKRYGWGWGAPSTWQGWLVLGIYLTVVVTVALLFSPETQPAIYISSLVVASLVLALVCWLKGEPTRWRWGK